MKLSIKVAVIILAMGALVAGCATPTQTLSPIATDVPAEEAAPMPAQGGTIARALTTEPSGLDPHGPPGSGQNILLPYIFDTLVYRDADNQYHPFLAESWDIAEDGNTITFKLKDGITFHDGETMDAEAVVYTFERFMELGSSSPVAGGLKDITSVTALDESTVQFEFDAPSAVFFGTVSMPYAGILSPKAADSAGESFAQHPVGTGPFMMESWDPGVAVTLARNPDYAWGPLDVGNKEAPLIDKAIFKVLPDASTQLAAFEAGETDVIFVNQPAHLAKLEQKDNLELTQAAINSLIYLGFNAGRAPLDEPIVRQALSHAINKQEILDTALGGVGKLACSPLASSLPGYDDSLCEDELDYDPAQSEALLSEAGFSKDDAGQWQRDGLTLEATLLTSTRAPNGDIATLIQSQLAAIGVPIEIQQLDARAAIGAMTEGDYDLMVWRYGWNDADVLNIYLASDRIGRTNRTFYSNADVDALLDQGIHEMDDEKRAALYQEAVRLIMADAAWQPLYEPVDVIAVGENAHDVIIGPMGRVLLNDAWVDPQ